RDGHHRPGPEPEGHAHLRGGRPRAAGDEFRPDHQPGRGSGVAGEIPAAGSPVGTKAGGHMAKKKDDEAAPAKGGDKAAKGDKSAKGDKAAKGGAPAKSGAPEAPAVKVPARLYERYKSEIVPALGQK